MNTPLPPVKPPPTGAAQQPDGAVATTGGFNADETMHFQTKMPKAPEWFCSFLASNKRETRRFRDELAHMKGAWPLLMKERRGGKWTDEDKVRLQSMVRSASSVSPYLAIWAFRVRWRCCRFWPGTWTASANARRPIRPPAAPDAP